MLAKQLARKNISQTQVALKLQNYLYEGFISSSYLLHGTGIILTDSNILYIGHLKHDQFNGYGLLIFDNSTIQNDNNYNPQERNYLIYGVWKKDVLDGPAVVNNQTGLIIGEYRGGLENGKIFFYNKMAKEWSSFQYTKGIKTKFLYKFQGSQQLLPQQLKQNTQLYDMYKAYLNKQFRDICYNPNKKQNKPLVRHKFGDNLHIGYDLKGYPEGLGVKIQNYKLKQAGVYQHGRLTGYGIKKLDNKCFYQGFFKNNAFQGLGLYHYSINNSFYIGVFKNNQCNQISHNGKGRGNKLFMALRQKQKKNHPKVISKKINLQNIAQKFIEDMNKFNQISQQQSFKYSERDEKLFEKKKTLQTLNSYINTQMKQNQMNNQLIKVDKLISNKQYQQSPIRRINVNLALNANKYSRYSNTNVTFSRSNSPQKQFTNQSSNNKGRIFKPEYQQSKRPIHNYDSKNNIAQQRSPMRSKSQIRYHHPT